MLQKHYKFFNFWTVRVRRERMKMKFKVSRIETWKINSISWFSILGFFHLTVTLAQKWNSNCEKSCIHFWSAVFFRLKYFLDIISVPTCFSDVILTIWWRHEWLYVQRILEQFLCFIVTSTVSPFVSWPHLFWFEIAISKQFRHFWVL